MWADDILNAGAKFAGAVSPLDLFQMQQLKKIGAYVDSNMAGDKTAKFGAIAGSLWESISHNSRRVMDARSNPKAAGFKHYFSGYKLGEEIGSISQSTLNMRMQQRRILAGGVTAYTAGSMLGFGGILDGALSLGVNAGIAGVLGKANPAFGLAYAGWGLLNMARAGDNVGPF